MQEEVPKLKAQLTETKGIFKSKERKVLETQIRQTAEKISAMLEALPEILKDDGYPDVQAFMATYRKAEAVVDNYNRELAEWETHGQEKPQTRRKRTVCTAQKNKVSVTSSDGYRQRVDNPKPSTDPTIEKNTLTSKITPQGSCSALWDYIHFDIKTPCKFLNLAGCLSSRSNYFLRFLYCVYFTKYIPNIARYITKTPPISEAIR